MLTSARRADSRETRARETLRTKKPVGLVANRVHLPQIVTSASTRIPIHGDLIEVARILAVQGISEACDQVNETLLMTADLKIILQALEVHHHRLGISQGLANDVLDLGIFVNDVPELGKESTIN